MSAAEAELESPVLPVSSLLSHDATGLYATEAGMRQRASISFINFMPVIALQKDGYIVAYPISQLPEYDQQILHGFQEQQNPRGHVAGINLERRAKNPHQKNRRYARYVPRDR